MPDGPPSDDHSLPVPQGTPPRLAEPASRPKVLVAEDQPSMRSLLGQALREAGYDVVEVQDGTTLWTELQATSLDEDNPREADLIVSDIRMPGGDGLQALARLRAAGWTTPVILITAFPDVATELEARRLGATRLLAKPFDVRALVIEVVSLVKPGE
jgi:DNA-binding response OmpR family regulator